MKRLFSHIRINVVRGLLASTPVLLCAVALYLLYIFVDLKVVGFLSYFLKRLQSDIDLRLIPGLGLLLFLVCLYLLGLIVSNIIGRQLFKILDRISQKIPLIKTVYGAGKQFSQSFSVTDQGKKPFKKAVLVKIDNSGLMVPAFVTGYKINRETNEELLIVLVPTAPTPASGFVFVVKSSQTVDPGWTVEECLKAIVSVGIISPQNIKLDPFIRKE